MKIRITSNPITAYGSFTYGEVLTSKQYPEEFLKHLVYEAGAAEIIEDKIIEVKETKKSLPSSQPAEVSQKTTRKKRTKKQKQ